MTNTSAIQLFNYGENPVRTIMQDGEIWFVAKDICDILELSNVSKALSTLDDDEKMTLTNSYSHETSGKCGGASTLKCINESGLYALIFKSIKPEAKTFRKWVTSEVLPQIRKTGSYSVHQETRPVSTEHVQSVEEKEKQSAYISRGILRTAKMVLESSGLKGVKLTLALDNVFKQFTGYSALELAGVQLIKKTKGFAEEHPGMTAYIWKERYEWKYPELPDVHEEKEITTNWTWDDVKAFSSDSDED